jgi:hypothetical protein
LSIKAVSPTNKPISFTKISNVPGVCPGLGIILNTKSLINNSVEVFMAS